MTITRLNRMNPSAGATNLELFKKRYRGYKTYYLCLPNVPGTTLPGTGPDVYQVSAAELMYYKSVAMTEPYVCASVDWSRGPNFKSGFHDRPEIQSAAKALGVIARKRPLTSCVQR